MTHNEYEALCLQNGLDPSHPIQENRHYKVTGWNDSDPLQVMRVWTDTVTPTMVKGHVSSKGYPLVDTCVWTRHLASAWTWTEE